MYLCACKHVRVAFFPQIFNDGTSELRGAEMRSLGYLIKFSLSNSVNICLVLPQASNLVTGKLVTAPSQDVKNCWSLKKSVTEQTHYLLTSRLKNIMHCQIEGIEL